MGIPINSEQGLSDIGIPIDQLMATGDATVSKTIGLDLGT
jgi:hypothetical protein